MGGTNMNAKTSGNRPGYLDAGLQEIPSMAPNMISLTPEDLQNLLKTAISEAVAQATKLNPLEQRKLDEELAKDRRKNAMIKQLGEIEERSMREKRDRCSHLRHPAGSGKLAGHTAPRGALGAEW